MRIVLLLVLMVLMTGCNRPVVSDLVEAEVIQLVVKEGWGGCFDGTPYTSIVRTPDGQVYKATCVYAGAVGTKITGCIITGMMDGYANGFKTGSQCRRTL